MKPLKLTPQGGSWFNKPMTHSWLVFGGFLLFLGVAYTCIGRSYIRYHGWVYRSKEPARFWWSVAEYYVAGDFLIAVDVFKLSADLVIKILFVAAFLYITYVLIQSVISQRR